MRVSRFDDYSGYDGYGGWGGFAPYVPVAARKAQAARTILSLKKSGRQVSPVQIAGRKIAATFWGAAWCDNLERYSDFANRIPRGRTYVRNGSVIDLQIGAGRADALVSGSSVYEVALTVAPVPARQWMDIRVSCAGGIDSLVELLQGRFSKGVMAHLCQQGAGLFPSPKEIEFDCSCPDGASMCKHVAAVLYGVGARLDHQPELLFRLRQVSAEELVATAAAGAPLTRKAPAAGKILDGGELADVFGVEFASTATPASTKRTAASAATKPTEPARAGVPTKPLRTPKKSTKGKLRAAQRKAISERMRRYWAERRRG